MIVLKKVLFYEFLREINKNFNNDNHTYANKQLIGHINLFRGVIVKEWVVSNQKQIDFRLSNKVIVKRCVIYHHGCWKRRCVMFHEQEVQRKFLRENVVAIKEENNGGV